MNVVTLRRQILSSISIFSFVKGSSTVGHNFITCFQPPYGNFLVISCHFLNGSEWYASQCSAHTGHSKTVSIFSKYSIFPFIISSPVSLRAYAAIFRASAFVDCAALLSMMITTTKFAFEPSSNLFVIRESVFNGSVVLEFHGVCSHISAEFCGLVFGMSLNFIYN